MIERFVELHNFSNREFPISNIQQLAERDHDFVADSAIGKVQIQLTELVEISFTFPMSQEEYDLGEWSESIQKRYGERPFRIDREKRDRALGELIEKKLDKNYSTNPSLPLWLIVFSTFTYSTEYYENGHLQSSEALRFARTIIDNRTQIAFDQIWFTDLICRPVEIWRKRY